MLSQSHLNNIHHTALLNALERLAVTFWGPTPEVCQQMRDGTFWEPFEALAPLLKTDPPDAVAQLKQICTTFKTSAELVEQLEEAYVADFINRRGGIRASLYASPYHGDDTSLMDEPVRMMEKRFAAKGLQMAAERNEPADHMAIQLEFCFFLFSQEKSDEARREAAQFVNEALLPWVPQFYTQLNTEEPSDFYFLTTALLLAMLNLISEVD